MTTIARDLDGQALGSEMLKVAMQLLSSAAQRGKAAASHAADLAGAAARGASETYAAAWNARSAASPAGPAVNGTTRSNSKPYRSSSGRPPQSAPVDEPDSQESVPQSTAGAARPSSGSSQYAKESFDEEDGGASGSRESPPGSERLPRQ